MIKKTLRRFAASRRSAVAVIMAISLVPLMLLVGIAVDFTFLYQSKTQIAFASEAAATQALRIAAATYALEVANAPAGQSATVTNTQASAHAIAAGQTAGNLWFLADLGSLTRATMTTATNALTAVSNTNPNGAGVGAPIFTAQVSPTTSYPPIFSPLFGSPTTKWVYASNASGTTSYAYAEILLMLDTSGSMLIGADNTTANPDIQTLELGTVCPKQGYVIDTDANTGYGVPGNAYLNSGHYEYTAADADQVQLSQAPNYLGGSTTTGSCAAGYGLQSPTNYSPGTGTTPGTPCALACHFSNQTFTNTYGTFTADYYGLARLENAMSLASGGPGVNLLIDILFNATENVISDMQNSEAVANQLSVGVYQFNTDVFPIVTGASGTGGPLPEATSDLGSALTAVQNVDYKHNSAETAVPQLINGTTVSSTPSNTVANEGGDTNFPKSLSDLQAGNVFAKKNGNNQALAAAGSGTTSTTPLKFMFIVTDGMEDDSPNNGSSSASNVEGEMTSISGETAGTGTCSYLKNTLGFTVYVLYVDYYPVANDAYYSAPTPGPRPTNTATNTDFPTDQNQSVQVITETPTAKTSPTALALQACASSPSNFYEASSSAGIQTALAGMLKSALASTIRLTN